MLKNLKNKIQDAGDLLKDKAGQLGDAAKEKAFGIIEDWVEIIPEITKFKLSVKSFGLTTSLSPTLEVEFKGLTSDFTPEKINEILADCSDSNFLKFFFGVIHNTFRFHTKAQIEQEKYVFIKLVVKLSPEIQVYIGAPTLY